MRPSRIEALHARAFLEDLATVGHVAAPTQNQAFNALLFFYRNVLKTHMGDLKATPRVRLSKHVPTVLSHNEALTRRVKDVDLDNAILTVHQGKGRKDRAIAPALARNFCKLKTPSEDALMLAPLFSGAELCVPMRTCGGGTKHQVSGLM